MNASTARTDISCLTLLLIWFTLAYTCDIKEFSISPSTATATQTQVTVKCEADNDNCRGKISISGQDVSSSVFDEWSSSKSFTPASAGSYTYECDFTHGGTINTRTATLTVSEKPCKISSFNATGLGSGSYKLQCEADCEGTMRLREEGLQTNLKRVTSTDDIDRTVQLTSYGRFNYVCLLTANNKDYEKTVTIQYDAPCGIAAFTTTNSVLELNSTTNYVSCQTQGCSGEVTITPPSGLTALGPIQASSGGTKISYTVRGQARYSGDYVCSFKGTEDGVTEIFSKTLTLRTNCSDPILSTLPASVYRNTNFTLTCDSRATCNGTTNLLRDGVTIESASGRTLITYTTQLTKTENIVWKCSVEEGGRTYATTQSLLVQDCEGGAEYTLIGTRCGKLDCDSGVNSITSCSNDLTTTKPDCRCPDTAKYWENKLCVTACSSGNVSAALAILGLSWWVYLIIILLILIILILLCCCLMWCCRKMKERKGDAEKARKIENEDPFSFAWKTLKTTVQGPQPSTKDNIDIKGDIHDYYEEPEYADDVEFSDDEISDAYLVPEDTIERLKNGQPPLAPALPSAPIPTLERDTVDECYNDPTSMQLKGDEGLVYHNSAATPDYPPREPDTPDIPKQDYKNLQDVPAKPQRSRRSSSSSSTSSKSIIPIIERHVQPDYGNIDPDSSSSSSSSSSKIQVKGKISEAQPDYDNLKQPRKLSTSSSSSSSSSKSSSKIEVKGKISKKPDLDYDNLHQPEQTYQNNKI